MLRRRDGSRKYDPQFLPSLDCRPYGHVQLSTLDTQRPFDRSFEQRVDKAETERKRSPLPTRGTRFESSEDHNSMTEAPRGLP